MKQKLKTTVLIVIGATFVLYLNDIHHLSRGTAHHAPDSGEAPDKSVHIAQESLKRLADDLTNMLTRQEYRYKPPLQAGLPNVTLGKRIKVPVRIAKGVAELGDHTINLTPETVNDFVFVVGVSSNHVLELKDGVASIQHFFPEKRIYFYDLGLERSQIKEIKSWTNVVYRVFDFSRYPQHFEEQIRTAAWKAHIIKEVLLEHGAAFWMDASIRLHSGNLSDAFSTVIDNDGLLLFQTSHHSNYAATHRSLYSYIPTQISKQKEQLMALAGVMLVYNTKSIFHNVLWWWMLCVYDINCHFPMRKSKCDFRNTDKMSTFTECHKYDQSSINVLLSNYHGYNTSKYIIDQELGLISVTRWETDYFPLQINNSSI